jgi:hypothetical protein
MWLSLIFFLTTSWAKFEANGTVFLENGHWISEWMEVEIPEGVQSLHFSAKGSDNSLLQISDVIDAEEFVWTSSGVAFGKKLSIYNQPILSNALSLNRAEAVVPGYGGLLLPNQLQQVKIPSGVWKVRAYFHKEPKEKTVKLSVQISAEKKTKASANVRVWVSQDSYWAKNKDRLQRILEGTKQVYAELGLNLFIDEPLYVDAPLKSPMDVPQDMLAIAPKLNDPEKLNLYFLSEMEHQSKPVNGLACIGGPLSQVEMHPCFAAVFAGKDAGSITLDQQMKIVIHELGHYFGLHHTQDTGYHGIKVVYDSFEDTPNEITGENLMDPGIHKAKPSFSPDQKKVLLMHPGFRGSEKF